MHKARKYLVSPAHVPNLFDAPTRVNLVEILDVICPAKTRRIGLSYGENCIILKLQLYFTDPPVRGRQMDGRVIAYIIYYGVVR